MAASKHIVICGAGVIGAAAAFELTRRGISVTVVERWRVAGAASGKSGGFLARDWCRGTPVSALAERSFDLHAAWAATLGDRYGYRKVDTFAAALSERRVIGQGRNPRLASWLTADAGHRSRIGSPQTTAQLDPAAFTTTLIEAALAQGGTLTTGAVTGLVKTRDGGRVSGVALADGREIPADAVIVAMGPWSVLASTWLPLPPVYGLKGHSIVFAPGTAFPAEAVFAELEDADGEVFTPEIVPRADGTLYVCGLSGTAPLPVDPSRVAPEPGGCERLRDIAIRLVPGLASAKILASQACYRPIAADGLPLIGAVPGLDGAFVATAHSVWGMLNAPGTAEALADLIVEAQPRHVDLAPFTLSRLAPLDPGHLSMGT